MDDFMVLQHTFNQIASVLLIIYNKGAHPTRLGRSPCVSGADSRRRMRVLQLGGRRERDARQIDDKRWAVRDLPCARPRR
jgi:hypothetical protein